MDVGRAQIQLNHPSFDAFISDLNPDVVVFDRFLTEEQFGWRVAEFAPRAIRILDTEDLHSLRLSRQEAIATGQEFRPELWMAHDTTKREIASIYRCDLSLIISSYEMKLLTETLQVDKTLLLRLPFMLDALQESEVAKWPSYENRAGFICIGNGKHAPNVDAVRWLSQAIWPLMRKELPQAEVCVYGAYLPESILKLHRPDLGFHVLGWVDDAMDVLRRCRISLAPLRFGAGIKGKLVDAMCAGTPSVTTSIGAEGMHGNYPWSGAVANTAEAFAESAVQLYRTPEDWQVAQRNGVDIVNGYHDKSTAYKNLDANLQNLVQNLEQHRSRNFIGAMLRHQSMAGTKYMSKWIEEKNKTLQ